mgnify:CR=1 FL=1
MRQLLRIAGTFPGLGLRVLATVDDHPSVTPPPEFETFGAGLQRHHCPTGSGQSFSSATTYQEKSVREVRHGVAELDSVPSITVLENGFTGLADSAPQMSHALASSGLPFQSASVRAATARRRVFGPGVLAGIFLSALAMVFLMFPRQAQTLKSWLLPAEARVVPAVTKAGTNATGIRSEEHTSELQSH